MDEGNWWVYILHCADDTLYTGSTTDVERRLSQHNAGKGAKYTRAPRPAELVYREFCGNRSAALRREAAIKRPSRAEKLALIARSGLTDSGPGRGNAP